nr:hypothetical protein [uncultured Allomuricauda sp.]
MYTKISLSSFWIVKLCAVILFFPFGIMAQKKIKPIKNPVAWSYTITPKNPLEQDIASYNILIDSHLSPMDWWDEVSWSAQVSTKDSFEKERLYKEAISDTLNVWADRYMAFNKYPYRKNSSDPDVNITLKTEEYKIENVQMDVDFSDMESAICEVIASARLTVSNRNGDILLDIPIVFYVNQENKSTLLSIRHFMLNPVFNMKYNLKKKPEKKRKLLNKKLAKYESDVLRYFYVKSGEILREHFMEQKKSVYAATFGIKNKGHEALNDASESTKKAINALSALSKKKRKTIKDIRPEIETAIDYWLDKLERTTDPEIRKLLHANLSLGNLFLGNIEDAKKCIHQIPEFETLEKKTLFQGGFNYYLFGLSEAISTKERHGDLAQIQ